MKKYWQSIEEYKQNSNPAEDNSKLEKQESNAEFPIEGLTDDEIRGKSNRRDFLKMLGFTVGYAAIATSCETPVRKAIPYLNQPQEVVPGIANYYASTFFDGQDYCSILVKTREGRPIKIEGNELSPISRGGTSARVQSSVLSLYDEARFREPLKKNEKADWETIDAEIISKLEKLSSTGKKIVMLSSTIISPATKKLIGEFQVKFPGTAWVSYDTISASALLQANEMQFGAKTIPSYHFEKADLIVGFNADFLGNWLSPVEFAKQYSSRRNLINGLSMSRHLQYESGMSLTGSNADERVSIKPSDEGAVLLNLYNEIANTVGASTYNVPASPVDVHGLALELLRNKTKSLLVSGSNDLGIQLIVNAINNLLGNYGHTIDLSKPMFIRQGIDQEMTRLVEDMANGNVGAMLIYNVNPAYDYPDAKKFADEMSKVSLSISFSDRIDETADLVEYVCPDNHYLESWNDAEPKKGYYSLAQPAIQKIFNTRQFQDSLIRWMGSDTDYAAYLEAYWEQELFSRQDQFISFSDFWYQAVHDGIMHIEQTEEDQPAFQDVPL
ncbi:MAG: molybdopterin oxidoreductase, partial [Bacteroidota bacterium]|nr:molybdopterin oxidoreductase [Bacteroidota bacterium]